MEILITYGHREEDLASLPIRDLALFVLEREGKPINTEVSISFVDDTAMAELNERFRGMEGPTDVLSFECDNIDDDITAAPGAMIRVDARANDLTARNDKVAIAPLAPLNDNLPAGVTINADGFITAQAPENGQPLLLQLLYLRQLQSKSFCLLRLQRHNTQL